MGWKAVRDHYRIKHIVCVTDEGICIGSPYIHNIIVIGLDGKIKKRDDSSCNKDLTRYQSEFDVDPELLKRLVQQPDTFSADVPVWTYHGGRVFTELCESPGYPNVTHNGKIQYENTHSIDRDVIVRIAKQNADAGVRLGRDQVELRRRELAEAEAWLAEEETAVRELHAAYPDIEP